MVDFCLKLYLMLCRDTKLFLFIWPKYWVLRLHHDKVHFIKLIFCFDMFWILYICVCVNVYECVQVCVSVSVFVVYFLWIWRQWWRWRLMSSAEEAVNKGRSVLTYLCVLTAAHYFSELSVYFCRCGLKHYVRGLLGGGFYTCYERKRAYEFLGCPGLTERSRTCTPGGRLPFFTPAVHHRWCSN